MENLKALASFLMILAGVLCTISILISLLRMVNTDDGTEQRIKIKHSLIAFTLVSTICVFVNLFAGYFDTAQMGIGTTTKEIGMIVDTSLLADKDKQEREIVVINNIKYVVTDRNVSIYKNKSTGEINIAKKDSDKAIFEQNLFGSSMEKIEGNYDVLRLYSESQDFFAGYYAEIKFYRRHTNELERKYQQNKSNISAYCTFNKNLGTSDNAGELISANGSMLDFNQGAGGGSMNGR